MRDLIVRKRRHLKIPTVLEAVKERLVEHRFNIDDYDIHKGRIEARRNSLDKVILGLYRNTVVDVSMDDEKERISIGLKWGGILSASSVSFFQFFLVSLAFLRTFGLKGFLMSILIGLLGSSMNMIIFHVLRTGLVRQIKRDLVDLEHASKEDHARVEKSE